MEGLVTRAMTDRLKNFKTSRGGSPAVGGLPSEDPLLFTRARPSPRDPPPRPVRPQRHDSVRFMENAEGRRGSHRPFTAFGRSCSGRNGDADDGRPARHRQRRTRSSRFVGSIRAEDGSIFGGAQTQTDPFEVGAIRPATLPASSTAATGLRRARDRRRQRSGEPHRLAGLPRDANAKRHRTRPPPRLASATPPVGGATSSSSRSTDVRRLQHDDRFVEHARDEDQ